MTTADLPAVNASLNATAAALLVLVFCWAMVRARITPM